jgi:chromosome segregation protein
MRFFKRLEIHGFKSFANRTTIDFHSGVTVVVGPNGCGKSNVFDSIRWVLGEQSARSLRGARMGDVLFNGSAAARPASVAKVTLVLDNSQRHLPIDFDEVAIGRRLYRNGDSEYVLNGQTARLRDIAALLLDTGIGTDGYSVMEQGRVDAIINSRPLERRALLDEAAGIAKYKARKEEALHKLRRTEEDLLRVADVLAEVRTQVGRLQRQAQKAARARLLQDEQDQLERELLARRWFQARLAGTAGEDAWHALGRRVEALKEEQEKVQHDEVQAQINLAAAQAEFEAGQEEQIAKTREVQDAKGRLDVLEERIAGWKARLEALEREAAAQSIERMALSAADMGAESEREAHRIRLSEMEARLATAKLAFHDLRSSGDETAVRVAHLRTEVNSLARAQLEADNRSRTAALMADRAATERDLARQDARELTDQLDVDHGNLAVALRARDEAVGQRETIRSSRQKARETLQRLEAALKDATAQYEKVRRERQDAATRHQALERLQDSHEGYFRGVKDVMAAFQSGLLKGIVGVAATLIEARSEHEVAIETALGGQAQDIVVKTAEDGKAAIRFLKETKAGRATFLPIDHIDPRDPSVSLRSLAAGKKGVVGWAVDLVKFPAEIKPAVQYLLGGTLVVDAIDTGISLQRSGLRTRIVTLEGELLNPSGAMSGGTAKSAGLLPRTREIRELADKIVHLKAQEDRLSAEGQQMVAEHTQARQDYDQSTQAEQQAEIDVARTSKDWEVAKRQTEDVDIRRQRAVERAEILETEVVRHRQAAETEASQSGKLAMSISTLEKELQELSGAATEHQTAVDKAGQDLRELELSVTSGAERARSLEERAKVAQRDLARLETAAQTRARETADLQQQLEETDRRKKEALAYLQAAIEEDRALGEKLVWGGQRREALTLDLRRVHERMQALVRDHNEARNELHDLEVRRAETGVQQEAIRLQAQERFQSDVEPLVQNVLRDIEYRKSQKSKKAAEEAPIDLERLARQRQIEQEARQTEEARANTTLPDEENEDSPAVTTPENISLPPPAEALARFPPIETLNQRLGEIRRGLENLGAVHSGAIDEWREASERLSFLTSQDNDLRQAKEHLSETIAKLDEASRDLFLKAFTEIRENFGKVFRRLFGGGRADLLLTEENGVLESGIDVAAMPPGKKLQHISLLSGGEKALTAVALLMAIFLRKPSPFCILDEIDAPLDDKNVERFKELVREFAETTQFIIITHNKQTMALADSIYGVTMQEQGVSRVVSVRLDQVDREGRITEERLREPAIATS